MPEVGGVDRTRDRVGAEVMKCATHDCMDDAAIRAYWPGQTKDFCVPCAMRAVNVAEAMGFQLSVVPIVEPGQETRTTT